MKLFCCTNSAVQSLHAVEWQALLGLPAVPLSGTELLSADVNRVKLHRAAWQVACLPAVLAAVLQYTAELMLPAWLYTPFASCGSADAAAILHKFEARMRPL
jgi:hypothetical protein